MQNCGRGFTRDREGASTKVCAQIQSRAKTVTYVLTYSHGIIKPYTSYLIPRILFITPTFQYSIIFAQCLFHPAPGPCSHINVSSQVAKRV